MSFLAKLLFWVICVLLIQYLSPLASIAVCCWNLHSLRTACTACRLIPKAAFCGMRGHLVIHNHPSSRYDHSNGYGPSLLAKCRSRTNMISLALSSERVRNASTIFTNEQGRDYLQDKDSIICTRRRCYDHSQNYSLIRAANSMSWGEIE